MCLVLFSEEEIISSRFCQFEQESLITVTVHSMCNVIYIFKVRKESRVCPRLKDFYQLSHKAVKYFKNPPVWWVEESEPLRHSPCLLTCGARTSDSDQGKNRRKVAELTWPSLYPLPTPFRVSWSFYGSRTSHWCSRSNGNSGAPFGRGTLPLSNQFKMNFKVTPSDWTENEACISNATGTGLRALRMQILFL